MYVTEQNGVRYRSDLGLSKLPGDRREGIPSTFLRNGAPKTVAPTGAVRPQPGFAAMADLTRGIGHDQGLSGVPHWSPPA